VGQDSGEEGRSQQIQFHSGKSAANFRSEIGIPIGKAQEELRETNDKPGHTEWCSGTKRNTGLTTLSDAPSRKGNSHEEKEEGFKPSEE